MGGADTIDPDRNGIDRAGGNDKCQLPRSIGFRGVAPHLLARSSCHDHIAARSGIRPGERTVTETLRLKAQATIVLHYVAHQPSTSDENKAARCRSGERWRDEDNDRRLDRFIEGDIKRCTNSPLPDHAKA